MTLIELLVLLLIAAICGSVGQAIAGFSRGGCLVSVILGFIGAMLGLWLKRQFGLPEPLLVRIGEAQFPVLWSIIGCALFVAVIGFLTGKRRSH
ncbi:MAG: hypothetical protein Q8M16_19460 [Pirellulaceae bacterium]|nr:hypothetical protein [Pirellulaceae bacterium]